MTGFAVRCLAAALAACLAAGVLLADCAAPVRVARPVVVKKTVVVDDYVAPVVVRFQAVIPLVDYGSYSAVYVPPVASPVAPTPAATPPVTVPQTAPAASGMEAVMAELKKIGGRLDALEKKNSGGPVVVPQTAPPAAQQQPRQEEAGQAALKVVVAKCAACHGKDNAAEKGGSLVLIDGGALAQVSARAANKVVGRSYAGTMPPKDSGVPALTDTEVGQVVAWYAK